MKNLGKAGVTILALGTAYGLGIISCVAYELKLFGEICSEVNKSKKSTNE